MAQVGSSDVLTWLRNIRELYNTIPTALNKIQGNKILKMDKWQNKEEDLCFCAPKKKKKRISDADGYPLKIKRTFQQNPASKPV